MQHAAAAAQVSSDTRHMRPGRRDGDLALARRKSTRLAVTTADLTPYLGAVSRRRYGRLQSVTQRVVARLA